MSITPIIFNYEPYLSVVPSMVNTIIFSFFLILCINILYFFLVMISFFKGSELDSGILRYNLKKYNTNPNNDPNHW